MGALRTRGVLAGATMLWLALSPAACGSARTVPVGDPARGRVITADQIAQSGARDAWEVLQRSGTRFRLSQNSTGDPRGISTRGRASMHLSSVPIIVVDGARLVDFRSLRQIPANIIAQVQLLNGIEGTRYFGTGGGNGVIVIHTTPGTAR